MNPAARDQPCWLAEACDNFLVLSFFRAELVHAWVLQGFTAFKLNVQLSREFNDKLARAAGKFKNQLVGSAYETWKQYAQHNKMLQSRLATAVGALRNRGLRSAFCGWREAALVRKEHKQKVRSAQLFTVMSIHRIFT